MRALVKFIKKEIVLWIALALAVLSMFVVKPDSRYLGYVDFRTLAILFCLMAVVAGFKRQGVFELLAEKLLSVAGSVRGMVTVLVLLCFSCQWLSQMMWHSLPLCRLPLRSWEGRKPGSKRGGC